MNDLQQGFTQRMRLLDAWKENPDRAAELRRIARETGVPQGLVDDDVIAGHRLAGAEQQLSGLKALPAAIRNSQTFATLAQDDMPTLASIEQLSQARKRLEDTKKREAEMNRPGFMTGALSEIGLNLKKIPAAMAQNRNDQQVENLRYTMQVLQDLGNLSPEMQTYYEQQIALYGGQFEEAKAEVAKINADIHALRPKDMHWAQEIIRGAVTSAPNTLAALGITLATRNPSAGALALGATTSATSTADARLEGLSFDDAQRKGMIDGAAETLFEVMPLGRMMALYRRGGGDVTQSALKQLGKATVSDMLGENATQFVQDMNNVMHGLDQELQDAIDKHGFFSPEVLKIQGERQLIATGTSALMSGAMGSPAVVMDALNNRERMVDDIANNMRQEQEQGLQNLADISKAVQDSKLRERAPEIFADLAHDIAANADHPHLYLDANALHQSGLMDVIADAAPELAIPIQEAAETGGAVQIPLADYLAKIAPDAGLVVSLSEHVRFEPEGLSLAEITHNAAAEMSADIEARAQEMAEVEALDAEVQTVKQNILDQLNAVGRFTPEANDKQATLVAATYETWAARLHTTPQELFARHPLRIVGEAAEGGFNQSGKLFGKIADLDRDLRMLDQQLRDLGGEQYGDTMADLRDMKATLDNAADLIEQATVRTRMAGGGDYQGVLYGFFNKHNNGVMYYTSREVAEKKFANVYPGQEMAIETLDFDGLARDYQTLRDDRVAAVSAEIEALSAERTSLSEALKKANKTSLTPKPQADSTNVHNPRNLPMDFESRMARARAMGFDTDRVYKHGSHDERIERIKSGWDAPLFEGLFSLETDGRSPYGTHEHRYIVKRRMDHRDFSEAHEQDESIYREVMEDRFPDITEEQLEELLPYVLETKDDLFSDGDDNPVITDFLSEHFGYDGLDGTAVGDASWALQNVRMVMARRFGANAVDMYDENGTSVALLPGSGVRNIDAVFDPLEADSDQLYYQDALPQTLDFGDRTTEQLEAEYAALQDGDGRNLTDNGHLIDVDLVRELSAEYRADRSLSPQIHRAASALSKELYARALARPVREDKEPKVRFMAGGGGSGKSSAAERFLGDNAADITFDGTLSNLDRAKANIDAALASGRDVEIVYVYRSPEKAAAGAIQRAIDTGRPVPVDVLAEAHAQSGKVVKALSEAYNDDERVSIHAIWNDGDSLDSTRLIPLEEIPDVTQEQAERAFRSALDRASLQGHVHPRTYAAFAESTRGNERANDDRSSSPGGQESTLDTLNQTPLSQNPAASGVFSSPEQSEFAATAERYGGVAAYEAARAAGETELTYRQWVQVRTPAFKAWFGDWENDPANASKVINERTGEPLVVYHGTTSDFDVFSTKKLGGKTGAKSAKKGFFFSDSKRTGNSYTAISDYDLVPARYHLQENATTKFSEKTPKKYQEKYHKFNDSYDKHLSAILSDMYGAIEGAGWTREVKRERAAEAVKKYDVEVAKAIEDGMEYHNITAKYFGKTIGTYNEAANYEYFVKEIANISASHKASYETGIGNPNIMEVFINAKDILSEDVQSLNLDYAFKLMNKAMDKAKKGGLDGVLVKNITDGGDKSNHIIVFGPNQIKSATANTGAFSPDNDSILYQSSPQSPRGAFLPDSNTIALLENADLSTFQHELGHFFLESMVGFANDLRHVDTLSGGGTLSETEKQMLRDVDILMDWFGLDLETWNRMTLAEKRPYHEQQARGFERFIMEGHAPSLELQGVFSRMLTWFLHLYKKLTALDVELSDEVRQVYGRMLASDEAIALAEQNRSMRQMFVSAEEAGMTVEEFAAYQQEGEGARSAALDEMRARVIRDAKYFGNAKNRALKAKQKEAREIRAELTMEARAMVMRQPVYRAWSILTAKMNADTTITKEKRPWTADLDPSHDSLFVAIAKLGGLDAAQAKSEWGFEDSIARPHPHHPVLRKSGGYSLDDMAGMLAEQGYLPPDYDLKDLESRFADEFAGNRQYSSHYQPEMRGTPVVGDLAALRLDHDSLIDLGYTPEQIAALGRKVRKKGGVHPDLLAEVLPDAEGNPVYDSGDALVQDLLAARPPQEAIRELTDKMMLERFGELSSPEAIAEAADMAAHNDIRLRAIATDAAILAKAVGGQRVLASAAKAVAQQTIANKKLKDIRPGQYARMETRAAKAAEQARKKGDIETAAAEKRNQVLQASLARAAWEAQEEAAKIVRYLKRMGKLNPKVIAIEYREQIEGILDRYNLRTQSGKALTRTQSLAEWVEKQREQGIEPDLPAHVRDEMQRTSWQNLTITELRGLADSIAQIEHLGRLKNKLLANRKQQDYDAVVVAMETGIIANATKSGIENRTPTTRGDKMKASVKRFLASHRKVAMIARMMDGEADGGPVTENLITTANRAADRETEWRGQASEKLTEILAPLIGRKDLNKKQSFVIAGKVRSFTHQDIFGMALNWGNDGNRQRFLDGEGWTEDDIKPLLARLTKAEWLAVQQVWNYIGSFKADIAAKERRVSGKEPDWVEPSPFTQTTADGETITLDGGYYPIKYDTRASETAAQQEEAELAKRQMYGAHTAATTKRSFTKKRVAEVHDRPLRYDLAGVYQGLNDVIHDLAWHEWLIDTNKLLRSKRLTDAIRDHYGADTLDQIKNWVRDIAEGDTQADRKNIEALHTIRKYASVAGLGFNVLSALKQPLGLMQSVARVGGAEVLASLGQFVAHPVRMTKEARAESSFMRNRAKTRFRELNEVRNALEQKNRVQQVISNYSYILIMAVQQTVDVITWHAQRNKSLAAGASFADANAHADQAVIDSQGNGMVKDLSAIERGNISRLFTVYYGFMNTVYNLEANALAAQKNSMGQKAATILMLAVVMPILDAALSDLLSPGDSGEWDEDDWAKSAGKAVANSLTGHFFALREIQFSGYGYQGPVGLRLIADAHKLIEQAGQGEFDRGFRKALINTAGSWMGLPAAQINRTWDGAEALADDKTDNPSVLLFGHQQPR